MPTGTGVVDAFKSTYVCVLTRFLLIFQSQVFSATAEHTPPEPTTTPYGLNNNNNNSSSSSRRNSSSNIAKRVMPIAITHGMPNSSKHRRCRSPSTESR